MSPQAASNWESGGVVFSAFALLSIYGYVFYLLNRQIRAKGYPPPFTWLSLSAAYITSIIGAAYGVYVFSRLCWACTPAANPEAFKPELIWRHIAAFAGSFVLGSIPFLTATTAVCLLLPRRERRPARRRASSFWRILSKAFLICLLVTPLASYL